MGYGMIEAIPDEAILALEDPRDDDGDGIHGFVNWVEALEAPDVSRVGRFGWKAQLPTIVSFSADAAHNELGLTSELLPFDNAANAPSGSGECDTVADPELPELSGTDFLSRVTDFQRFMSPPPQAPRGGMRGESVFEDIGCATCHAPSFTTSSDPLLEEAIRGREIRPYSDFLLHFMPSIPDGVPAGLAGPADIRTPPLWGLRSRPKLMHDGSVIAVDFDSGVVEAIMRHGPVGEAAASAADFVALQPEDQDALVRFLRSLGRQDFDIDDDGDVDLDDLELAEACRGAAVTPEEPCGVADLDQDGMISDAELEVLAAHLGVNGDDCNNDGVDDAIQIADGTSLDVDENGVPDECDGLPCGVTIHRFFLAGGSPGDVGVFSTSVEVPDIGEVAAVRLTLQGFTHDWAEQLGITLDRDLDADTHQAVVSQFCGFDWDFIGRYEFRDDAAGGASICFTVSGGTIPTGSYLPLGSSSVPTFGPAFTGLASEGTWTLDIQDIAPDGLVANLEGAFLDIMVVSVGSDCDGDGISDDCELDSDGDGIVDDCDGCPDDPEKSAPGECGCGVTESDTDGDGQPDCVDGCPLDPFKSSPGTCGCGVPDLDSDQDGAPDCIDLCPDDPDKIAPGECGCGVPDVDSDGDGIPDCGGLVDCNANGIDDSIDIATGASSDCNGDGLPDECQPAGAVVVVGEDSHGETSIPGSLPVCTDVAAGGNHVAVVTSGGEVICWGRNADGECDVPLGLPPAADVACGAGHTLVIDQEGYVHAWGRDNYGQSEVPGDLGTCTSIAGGRFHSVALQSDGTVRCWGRDQYGESSPPTFPSEVVAIGAGDYHSLAVLDTGEVMAWGRNGDGQIDVPVGLTGCVEVAGGSFHSVARRADGSVVAWGRDYEGQTSVPAGLEARAIAAGTVCTMAIDVEGALVAWGDLSSGKGDLPHAAAGLEQIDTGGTHAVLRFEGLEADDSDGDGIADCADPCPSWPGDCSEDGTIVYVEPGDSIPLAISKVPDGGTLKLRPGVYNQVLDFAGRSIAVEGDPDAPGTVVLDGTGLVGSSVVLMVTGEDADSILRGVTVRNGISGSLFLGGAQVGGGLHTFETSPVVEDCVFEANMAEYGGAVYARKGSPVFRRCVFLENIATNDGGAFHFSRTVGGLIVDSSFEANNAGGNGGAIHMFDGDPTIIGTRMSGNSASGSGGAASWASFGGLATLVDMTITGNEAGDVGGGIFVANTNGALTLVGSTVCENAPDQIIGQFTDLGGNAPCSCPGDFDGDGFVGGSDLGSWLVYAGSFCTPDEDCPWDLDGDGEIAGADLGIFLSLWGVCR